jgi:hypothetical protein
MGLWWPHVVANEFAGYAWDTWFWAVLPHPADYTYWAFGWPGYHVDDPDTYYWFRKISASDGHQQQLAIRSPVDRVTAVHPGLAYVYSIKANVIYICCYDGDTPNWVGAGYAFSVAPPCSNWLTDEYGVEAITRSQTSGMRSAIMAERSLPGSIISALAKTKELSGGISASLQTELELPDSLYTAIQGDVDQPVGVRASIMAQLELPDGIISALAKTDELPDGIKAAIRGNTQSNSWIRTAIWGETEKEVGIVANIVISRKDTILLEMENLIPQEMDIRSTPNWRSRVKDYRKTPFGE